MNNRKILDTLNRYSSCRKNLTNCDGVCEKCEFDYTPTEFISAIEASKYAIEKQIPKKPINLDTEYRNLLRICPSCNAYIVQNLSEIKIDYCIRCGQKLDWSDEECSIPTYRDSRLHSKSLGIYSLLYA